MPTRSVTVSRRSRSLETITTVACGALLGAQQLEDALDVTGSRPAAGSS
jgi:hypothetical protein